MPLFYKIETEQETDGRWLAEAINLPGVLAYGESEDEAIKHAEAIALLALADRVESEEVPARGMSISFGD